jgi:hypothetical protein
VVLLAYALAVAADRIPQSFFLIILGLLALLSVGFSFLAGQTNVFVTIYGLRTNYLHVPLIWVMAKVLDRDDVEKLGSFLLITSIGMTILMVLQWNSPQGAWVNRGVGGDAEGGIHGAQGRMRPPGLFSFITGVMVYYPLVAAFGLYQVAQRRRLWWPLLIACVAAVIVALPISISRGAMIATCMVAAVFVGCLLVGTFQGFKVGSVMLFRVMIASVALFIAIAFLPFFDKAKEVFMDRWDTAAGEVGGNAWTSLYERVAIAFTTPLDYAASAPVFGYGIGVGSNVGAKLLAGRTGFLLTEDEWGKCLFELGPMLGFAFIFYRMALVAYLGIIAARTFIVRQDMLPLLVYAACFPVILLNQWGQATQLGFAVVGGGLLLAAVHNPPVSDEELEEDESTGEEPAEEVLSEVEIQRRRMRGLM